LSKYTARFSGHQTFPLRYGWLYKFYQTSLLDSFNKLTSDDLMVEWGVGRNMVDAVKYWADRVGISSNSEYSVIDKNDADLDKINSVWLIHWLLCRNAKELTAYRIFFNFYNGQTVTKVSLALFIKELFELQQFQSNTKKAGILQLSSENTVSKDISTLFLTYSSNKSVKVSEDSFSSPLSELGLIKQFDKQTYLCELEERTNLSDAVFVFALIDYFERLTLENRQITTISFDAFLLGEGSPARIFRMSQAEVELRLERAVKLTENKIGWTDTQGLRQIQIKDNNVFKEKNAFLNRIYK